MRRGEISVQDHAEGDRHTVKLGGELDLATSPELVGAVYAILAEEARVIVLDVGALTFIDSTCIRSILSVQDKLFLAVSHKASLALGQRVLQDDGDDVLVDVGPGLGRASSCVVIDALDDQIGDCS